MKHIYKLFLIPSSLFCLTSCGLISPISSSEGGSSNHNSSGNGSSSNGSSIIDDNNPVITNSQEYELFWNPTTELKFNITMSIDAANFINDKQSNHDDSTYFDYYVPCTFSYTMNGVTTTIEEVGIREKGNLSRRAPLDNGNFSLNTLAHYKLSFKETFDGDEYDNINELKKFKKTWANETLRSERKNRRLFDMEKIDIKWNRNDDKSKVRQSYALKTFRENGVLAPNSTLANVTLGITGKSPINTTYEVFECIDSVFIKRHFSSLTADGDLYKCTYSFSPANFNKNYRVNNQIGIEDNTKNYHPVYDLKTNKKKSSEHKRLLKIFDVVNDTTSDASTFKSKVEQVIDMKSFMMYESIAYLLGNFDDMRNNANNYYLYIASTTEKAYFIPYDFDRCLGCGTEGRQEYMTSFSPESTKMQCNGEWQSINLFWRTVCTSSDSGSGHSKIERVEDYRMMYQNNIENIVNKGIMSSESFASYVNSFPSSYRGSVNGDKDGNCSFEHYFDLKIEAIKKNTQYNIEK